MAEIIDHHQVKAGVNKQEGLMNKITACFTIFLLLSFSFAFSSQQADKKMPVKINKKVVHQVFPERIPGTFDPVEYLKAREETNNWLMWESGSLSSDAIYSIHLMDSEMAEINNVNHEGGDKNQRAVLDERVGIVKAVGLEVNFSGVKLETLSAAGRFTANGMMRTTTGGGVVWTAVLESQKASGLRVHFTDVNLPENAALYIYNLEGEAFGPYIGREPGEKGNFWSNTVIGSTVFVQLHVPGPVSREALRSARFVIRDIGLLGEKFLLALLEKTPSTTGGISRTMTHCDFTAPCVEDASCYDSSTWGMIDDARLSIALMLWVSGPYMNANTGGLVADTDPGTQIPYFLTAGHTIDDQTLADSVECYWRYWTEYCHAPCYWAVGVVPRTLGSTLLSHSLSNGNYSLLQLDETPPPGSVLMGWTTEPAAYSHDLPLYRISHPRAAPQAYSQYSVDVTSPQVPDWPRGVFIYSKNVVGATEGGSGGTPVFNAAGQIVGQRSGRIGYNPGDPCDYVSNWIVDGAFANYFPEVEEWLDPTLPPVPPSGLTARAASCTQINLSWEDNSDSENEFRIERSSGNFIFQEVAVVPAGQTTFSDTGLDMDTSYLYRVRACNDAGCSEYSNVDSAKTYGPPSPPKLAGEQTGEYEIKLWWKHQNLSITITKFLTNLRGFHVYRASSPPFVISPPFERIATLHPGATKFVDQRIIPGRTYYYKVCAFNRCGESCSKVIKVETH